MDNEVAGTSESLADINKYTSEYTGVNFEEKDLNINSEYIDAIKKECFLLLVKQEELHI